MVDFPSEKNCDCWVGKGKMKEKSIGRKKMENRWLETLKGEESNEDALDKNEAKGEIEAENRLKIE